MRRCLPPLFALLCLLAASSLPAPADDAANAAFLGAFEKLGVPDDIWAVLSPEAADLLIRTAEARDWPDWQAPLSAAGCLVTPFAGGRVIAPSAAYAGRLDRSASVQVRGADALLVMRDVPADLRPLLARGAWLPSTSLTPLGRAALHRLLSHDRVWDGTPEDVDSPNTYFRVVASTALRVTVDGRPDQFPVRLCPIDLRNSDPWLAVGTAAGGLPVLAHASVAPGFGASDAPPLGDFAWLLTAPTGLPEGSDLTRPLPLGGDGQARVVADLASLADALAHTPQAPRVLVAEDVASHLVAFPPGEHSVGELLSALDAVRWPGCEYRDNALHLARVPEMAGPMTLDDSRAASAALVRGPTEALFRGQWALAFGSELPDADLRAMLSGGDPAPLTAETAERLLDRRLPHRAPASPQPEPQPEVTVSGWPGLVIEAASARRYPDTPVVRSALATPMAEHQVPSDARLYRIGRVRNRPPEILATPNRPHSHTSVAGVLSADFGSAVTIILDEPWDQSPNPDPIIAAEDHLLRQVLAVAQPATVRQVLTRCAATSTVPFLAVVPSEQADGAAKLPVIRGTPMPWSALLGAGADVWSGPSGAYLAVLPPAPTPDATTGPGPTWTSGDEARGRSLASLLTELTPEQSALVANGHPLQPAALSEAAKAAVLELVAASSTRGRIACALDDPHSRLLIALDVTARLDHSDRGGSAKEKSLRSVEATVRPRHGGPQPLADEAAAAKALAAYEAYLIRTSAGDEPSLVEAPLAGAVAIAEPWMSLPDLASALGAAVDREVRVPHGLGDARVAVSPGEWPASRLLDALSASLRMSLVVSERAVRFQRPIVRVAPTLVAQMEFAGDWFTHPFTAEDLVRGEPVRVDELTREARRWVQVELAGNQGLGRGRIVRLMPRVTVNLQTWTPLEPVGGATDSADPFGPGDPPEHLQLASDSIPCDWFWQRLPEGW